MCRQVLVGKAEGKSPRGRSKRRWRDNIKTDLQEWNRGHGLGLSGSGQGQVACSSECGNESPVSVKYGSSRLAEELLASQKGLRSVGLIPALDSGAVQKG